MKTSLRSIICAIACLATFVGGVNAGNVTYYIDADGGSDANTGTSPDQAWATLAKASSHYFEPGDQILLRAGDVFTGKLLLDGDSGRPGRPIIIDSYDEGPPPLIDASGYLAGVHIRNAEHVVVRNLEITANGGTTVDGSDPTLRYGVYVDETYGPFKTGSIKLQNLYIHDIYPETGVSSGGATPTAYPGTAISVRGTGNYSGYYPNNVIIEGCRIERTGLKAIELNRVRNAQVLNNDMKDIGGPAIQMGVSSDIVVRGNVVDGSGSFVDPRMHGRGSGIWPWSCERVLIERNRFMHARGHADSCGMHIDFNCRDVVIQYNLSVDNAGGFIEILGNNHNCTYRYNISINDGSRVPGTLTQGTRPNGQYGQIIWVSGYVGGNPPDGPYNSYLYNNTIYVKESIAANFSVHETTDGLLIANNIFYIAGPTANVTPYTRDNYTWSMINRVVWANNLYLRAGIVPSSFPFTDSAPLFGDPLFINAGGLLPEDYIPQSQALVEDTGIFIDKIPGDSIGLTIGLDVSEDFFGNPIIGPPNMGAIEISQDYDGDGLYDWDEVNIHGTDPLNPDSDSDGLPDGWEVEYGLNPLLHDDDAGDDDGDGLTHEQEYHIGTNPLDPDTDGDGLQDGLEIDLGFNPLIADIETHYVDKGNITPVYPYATWSTAANDIQAAVDAAVTGHEVVVTNGHYVLSSEILVNKNIKICSANGPKDTVVDGNGLVRCFNLSNSSAIINGLTVSNGFSYHNGGGIYCSTTNPAIAHSVIINNWASEDGGGIYKGSAYNCTISGNSAGRNGGGISLSDAYNSIISGNKAEYLGGAIYRGNLYNCVVYDNEAIINYGGAFCRHIQNCTVVRNHASWLGGVYVERADNSIVAGNTSAAWDEADTRAVYSDRFYNSCSPDLIHGANGNITNMPNLASVDCLSANSPCIGAGDAAFSAGSDLHGKPWLNPPSMGCTEFYGEDSVGGDVSVALSGPDHIAAGKSAVFRCDIDGMVYLHVWDFGDGICVTNNLQPTHRWESAGTYDIVLTAYNSTYPEGISSTQTVFISAADAVDIYVSPAGSDANDGSDWANAKQTIQAGVSAQEYCGGAVYVSNGYYAVTTGIEVSNSCDIIAVGGADLTTVDGGSSCRPFNLHAPDIILRGFTVTNGYTTGHGGGILCSYDSDRIIDCIISGNRAHSGGGIKAGSISNTIVRSNQAEYLGGGIHDTESYHSIIHDNYARRGGGAQNPYLENCLVYGNTADERGGGSNGGIMINSTVTDNYAGDGGGIGGSPSTHLENCIVWGNSNSFGVSDISYIEHPGMILNSCAAELTNGLNGNISYDPLFVDAYNNDSRLLATSPCIDAGANDVVISALDLDGNPRIMDGDLDGFTAVDMGAYEFPVIKIDLDIVPGSKVNPINLKSKGRCQAAVLTTEIFDAAEIDPASIRLAGAAPIYHKLKKVNADGELDLFLHFDTQDLELTMDSIEAVLIGQTYDKQLLIGEDSIRIVPEKK